MGRQVWTYIIIAYSITWIIIFGIFFLYRQNVISFSGLNICFAFGALGPFLSAIICSRLFYNKRGVKLLFGRLQLKKIELKSLLLSLFPLLLFVPGYFLYPVVTGIWFSFDITNEVLPNVRTEELLI